MIITQGQPSTNPRMVKEVEALLERGFDVKVFYSYWAEWASLGDEVLKSQMPGVFVLAGGTPTKGVFYYYISRVIRKIASGIYKIVNIQLEPYIIARNTFFLLKKASGIKADLYIAHTIGALYPAYKAAKKFNSKFAFDAEDYHQGEYAEGHFHRLITKKIEDKYIESSSYVTAASPLIARQYAQFYFKNIQDILNVFPLRYQSPFRHREPSEPLRMFWFSQTIGRDRGIQDVITAFSSLIDIPIQLDLLGACNETDKEFFLSLVQNQDNHTINILSPCTEKELFKICAQHDIGLALERNKPLNRDICLTNKIFTYILSGNAILASSTSAQNDFITKYSQVGCIFPIGGSQKIADIIRCWWENPERLEETRRAAWELGHHELNWEKEKEKLMSIIEQVLP